MTFFIIQMMLCNGAFCTGRNLGRGLFPGGDSTKTDRVDSMDNFIYLGSVLSFDGYSHPDINRRMSLALSVMSSLSHIWQVRHLSLITKTCIYQVLVLFILLYVAETRTLLDVDSRVLKAFYVKCQRLLPYQ